MLPKSFEQDAYRNGHESFLLFAFRLGLLREFLEPTVFSFIAWIFECPNCFAGVYSESAVSFAVRRMLDKNETTLMAYIRRRVLCREGFVCRTLTCGCLQCPKSVRELWGDSKNLQFPW